MAASRYSVVWAETAADDLRAIVDFISQEDPEAAASVLDLLEGRAERLAAFPERGRVVRELEQQGVRLYRELVAAPWRLIYRIEGRSVRVLAVVDARRNLEDLLLDRFIR